MADISTFTEKAMERSRPVRVKLAFTRSEIQRLHGEIGDLPKSRVGPKLLALYRHLGALLALEWDEKNLKQQQRRGVHR